jgi:hypothetical protein
MLTIAGFTGVNVHHVVCLDIFFSYPYYSRFGIYSQIDIALTAGSNKIASG